ncbi:flagellar basal-body rod protein FlgF [Tepidamorphus sp. 3E244]|uniref:flagellar basal-body rod protein FlgF n=1 Tax=Tepidamorphus sp. 3E244 TaxID=3385498 RepID=UPI0038FC1BEC
MENALLIGLSRQVALRREMDVIANNVANLGTTGFKKEAMLFEEYQMPKAEWTADRPRDRELSYVHDLATIRDYSPGAMVQTGNPLDVAINGEGWFVVNTPVGERYTRNGAFLLNQAGELVTNEGYQVLGEGGPMTFGTEDTDIAIASDGTVSSAAGNKGRLRVVEFETNMVLRPEGSSLFTTDAQATIAVAPRVAQGVIEKSNVQPILEISRMIEVNRAYQSLANTLEKADQLRRNAIGKLADIPS